MLLLLFHIGENLYAIDTAPVVEILPMVLLRKIEPAPEHIAGVFNYRGNIVPVVDLCRLLRGTPCAACYSSRMVMVNYRAQNGGDAGTNIGSEIGTDTGTDTGAAFARRDDRQRQFGLLVERVTETLKVSREQLKTAESVSHSPYLGDLFVHEQGMIQQVNWEQLITDADRAAGGRDRANGAERN